MNTNWLLIFLPIAIHAIYDFSGWYGIIRENSSHRFVVPFRIIKFILDFPITYFLMVLCGWELNLIIAFYIAKQFGWCDAVYILIWKLLNWGLDYTEEGIWWLFWTPLGLIRSQIIYSLDLSTFELYEYTRLFGKYYLLKGQMSLGEFQLQLVIGLFASGFLYLII